MSTTIGSLIAELGIDDSRYRSQLKQAHQDGLKTVINIEKDFKAITKNLKLNLTPVVNHKPLTELNKHLTLKEKHVKNIQSRFDANPLTPRVDTRELDKLRATGSLSSKISVTSPTARRSKTDDLLQEISDNQKQLLTQTAQKDKIEPVKTISNIGVDTVGSVFQGALQGAGQGITEQITKPLGKGLSTAIEQGVSGLFGSTELLGETIGNELSAVFRDISNTVSPELIDRLKSIVPEEQRVIRGLVTRGNEQQRIDSFNDPALRQATVERRASLRDFRDIERASFNVDNSLLINRQLQQRGANIQGTLKAQRTGLPDDSQQAQELDSALTEVANQLMALADEESDLIADQQRMAEAIKEARESIESAKTNLSSVTPEELPQAYDQALTRVAGNRVSADQAPKLVVADDKLKQRNANALYGVESNTILVTQNMMDAINQGQLTLEQMETLYHELQHAVDWDFGSTEGVRASNRGEILGDMVVPTPEEIKSVAPLINQYSPEERGYELNAEIRGRRNAQAAYERQQADAQRQRIYSATGVGGVNYSAQAKATIGTVQDQLNDLDQMAQKLGITTTDGIEALSDTLRSTATNVSRLVDQIASADSLNSTDLVNLQNALGEQFESLQDLQIQLSEVKKDFLSQAKSVMEDKNVAQQIDKNIEADPWSDDLPTTEKRSAKDVVSTYMDSQLGKFKGAGQAVIDDPWGTASDAANMTGKAVRAAIEATQKELFILNHSIKLTGDILKQGANTVSDIYQSAPVQAFVGGVISATNAMDAVAGTGYRIASSVESLALDMVPMGRTAKGVMQQTVVPAALFGAGAHMLPGGEMAASYLMDTAANALGPAGAAASHALGTGATEAISSSIPNVLGLSEALSASATGAIELVTNGAVQIIANAGVAIAGGKVIQGAMGSALPPVQPSSKALPAAQTPFQLPPTPEKETILVEATQVSKQLKSAQTSINKASKQVNQTLESTSQQAVDIVSEFDDIDTADLKSANINQAKEIGKKFQGAYAKFKEVVDSGNQEFASTYAEVIQSMAEQAKRDIESLMTALGEAGEDTSFGSEASNKINSVKGQIARKRNEVQRYLTTVQKGSRSADDELSAPRLDLERLGGKPGQKGVLSDDEINQLKELDKLLEEAENAADRFDSAMNRLDKSSKEAFDKSAKNLDETVEAFGRGELEADKFEKKVNQLGNIFKVALGAFAAFQVGQFLLDFGKQFAADAKLAALGLEQMTIQLTRLEGTAGAARSKIQELRDEADRLGVSGTQAVSGYVQIAASTQGTVLEGAATDQIASASVQAASGLSLDAESAERVNMAMAQMASKGKISAEEIRGQMGDVLPGAFQIAARSMGMTTQEFDKLMSSGQVFSEDFLPKFAQQLAAEIPAASDSAQASINRFNSQIDQLQETVGKPLLDAQTLGLNILVDGLEFLQKILPLIGTLAATIGVNFAVSFGKASLAALGFNKAVLMSSLSVGSLVKSVTALAPAAIKAARAFAALALKFAVMQAVIDVFKIISTATADSAKETSSFTADASAGMEKYRSAIAEVRDELKGLASDLPKDRSDLVNTSLLEGTAIGGVVRATVGEDAGNSLVRGAEKNLVNNAARFTLPGILFDQGSKLFGGEGLVTQAEKAANDQAIAFNEMMDVVNETLSASYSQLGVDGKGAAELGQQLDIDKQLERLNSQRQGIAVGDNDARLKIEKEINQLLERRQKLSAATGSLQGNIAKQIEFLNKYRETLQERKSAGAITESDYDRELNLVNNALEELTDTQERFNNLNKESANQLQLLSRALSAVATQLAAETFKNQINAGQRGVNIAKARLAGSTVGEIDYTNALLQRDQANTQITTNNRAITSWENTLGSSKYTEALENAGLAAEATSFEIQQALERLQDGSLKSTLEEVADFRGRIETLQLDTLGLEEQMLQAQAEANDQIRDANREIAEYYRNVSTEADQLASQVKEISAQTEFASIKNKLKSSMSGLSGSFFDDWIGGFMGFLDSLQEIIQARIDADRQRMEAQQQQFAQMQQLSQIQRGLPGIAGGVFGNNAGGSGVAQFPVPGMALKDAQITSDFGYRTIFGRQDFHEGIDIGVGGGTDVLAARSGRVSQIKPLADQLQIAVQSVDEMGRQIEEWYIHTSDALVQVGDTVQAGQKIAEVAHTTQTARNARVSTGDHLDYRVRVDGDWVDPKTMLSGLPAGGSAQGPPMNVGTGFTGSNLTVKGKAATQEQIGIAQRIYQVGSNLGATSGEIQAAIATAIQESVLTNLNNGDRDSLGIFQQRPSMEWGTRKQIQNPDFAIESFFLGRGSNRGMIENRGRAGGDVYQQSHLTQASAHPDAPRQWDNEAAALLRAVSGGSTPQQGVNMGQFSQLQTGTSANSQLEMDLISQREQLSVNMAQAQADLQMRGLINQGTEQLRSIADQSIQIQQQLQDRVIDSLPQGDVRSMLEETIGQARQGGTETTGMARQLEDSATELEAARAMLDQLESNRESIVSQVSANMLDESNLAQYDVAIAQFKQLISESEALDKQLRALQSGALDAEATQMLAELTRQTEDARAAAGNLDPVTAATQSLRRELESLEANQNSLSDIFRDSIDDRHTEENVELLVAQFEELNKVKIDGLLSEIQKLEESVQLVQDATILEFKTQGLEELTRILNRSGQPGQAQDINYQNQLDQINVEERQALQGLNERTDLSDEAKEQTRGLIGTTFSNRRENAAYDFDMLQRSSSLEGREAVLGARQGLFGAQQKQANMLGFGGTAAMKQEEMNFALEDQQINYEREIESLYQLKDAGKLTAEAFAEMQAAIEATNQLSIENIKTQFSDLPEIVGAIKQPMTDALGAWIQGTKSFDDAFSDMLSSILSNLVSMMANKAIEGLLGSLFGGMGGSGAGNTGGIPGMGGGFGGGGLLGVVGGLFGGLFKDGGKVGFMGGGHLRGSDPIKDAMKKEGPGARLIVANTTEWVLNRKHQDILKMYGVDERVLGFKNGGPIGPSTGTPLKAPGSTNNVSVSVPVTVNNSGGEETDGAELAKRIAGPVKSLIATEIEKMQRPGGQLRRRQRR